MQIIKFRTCSEMQNISMYITVDGATDLQFRDAGDYLKCGRIQFHLIIIRVPA